MEDSGFDSGDRVANFMVHKIGIFYKNVHFNFAINIFSYVWILFYSKTIALMLKTTVI